MDPRMFATMVLPEKHREALAAQPPADLAGEIELLGAQLQTKEPLVKRSIQRWADRQHDVEGALSDQLRDDACLVDRLHDRSASSNAHRGCGNLMGDLAPTAHRDAQARTSSEGLPISPQLRKAIERG